MPLIPQQIQKGSDVSIKAPFLADGPDQVPDRLDLTFSRFVFCQFPDLRINYAKLLPQQARN